jgi:DNA adenine methylase
MVANRLVGGDYVEPYAGGAGVAITLLGLEYARHIHINDINRAVHAFWWAVLNENEALCGRIRRTRVTMREWQRQREVQTEDCPSPLDLAFSTFFLNRTNRSGIVLGGVIGGKAQAGEWKLDARFNKEDLISRIERIGRWRRRINLYNLDAAHMLTEVLPQLPKRSLVYLDPPYYVKGSGLYEHHYKHSDHAEIARMVGQISQPWLVSYDDVPEIRELYLGYRQQPFSLTYSAQSRYQGAEVMIFADKLATPDEVITSRSAVA